MKFKPVGNTSEQIPVIGQGTGIGGHRAQTATYGDKHVRSLRTGIDLGMTLIDTAEEYGDGRAEEIVGMAVRGIRDKVFIATKFSPEHNSYNNILNSVENSLLRLKTDYIDLYQVHWPNPQIPIEQTMRAMEQLVEQGKIRYIGVSNFYLKELKDVRASLLENAIVSIQVEYNLFDRGIENYVLPFCEDKSITVIAYSPLDQGTVAGGSERIEALEAIAARYDKTVAQIALNWLTAHSSVIAIPKATDLRHLEENASSVDFDLSKEDFDEINKITNTEWICVPTERIYVVQAGQGNRRVYQTIEEALENKLGFVPSPLDLSRSIEESEFIKPVRVVRTDDGTGRYDYDLVEGRIRYWAWVIAHDGKKPIPVYVRQALEPKEAVV